MTPPLLRRGSVVRLGNPVASGDPQRLLAVVVQADRWLASHPSICCCPITSRLVAAPLFRLSLEPSLANGLPSSSQLMVDKLFTAAQQQVRQVVGVLEGQELAVLERALRQWLELA